MKLESVQFILENHTVSHLYPYSKTVPICRFLAELSFSLCSGRDLTVTTSDLMRCAIFWNEGYAEPWFSGSRKHGISDAHCHKPLAAYRVRVNA